jgi:hypothetical protein
LTKRGIKSIEARVVIVKAEPTKDTKDKANHFVSDHMRMVSTVSSKKTWVNLRTVKRSAARKTAVEVKIEAKWKVKKTGGLCNIFNVDPHASSLMTKGSLMMLSSWAILHWRTVSLRNSLDLLSALSLDPLAAYSEATELLTNEMTNTKMWRVTIETVKMNIISR